MRKRILWLALLALLLLLPSAAAFADGPGVVLDSGQIFVDEDVSLEPGETFDGDLGIFSGDLTVPEGSVVNGDVFVTDGTIELAGRVSGDLAVIGGDLDMDSSGVVEGELFGMGGNLDVAGRVEGNLSIFFGDAELRDGAVVEGDLMVLSGTLEREAGARVLGEDMPEIDLPRIPFVPERIEQLELPDIPDMPEMPEITRPSPPVIRPPQPDVGNSFARFVSRAVSLGFFSLLFVALGILIVFVWPRATHRVAECIIAMPVQSFGLGLLTFVIAAVLEAVAMVLMILIILVAAALISTVILIPIGLLLILLSLLVLLPVPLALAGAMVLGWVGLAEVIGRKAVRLLNAGYVRPLGAVLVGLILTVPLAAVLWFLQPLCCGWPFVILLISVGLGAAIHTRFGRQDCSQSRPSAGPELLPAEAMDEEAGRPDGPETGTA